MSHQHDADYFDFVIFGATGFTAGFVLEEIVHHNRLPSGFTWAIAGRKEQALQTIKEKYTGISGIPAPGIIVADVQSGQGLLDMAKSAKLVLNCVGPYRYLGEPVVKACIEGHADYLDLCGEPEFIEKMSLQYHDQAVAAGVTILHAAAFDSVPCDLGVLEMKRALLERGATPSSIEVFFRLNTESSFAIHYATYEAAVLGFGSGGTELARIRKALAKTRPKPSPIGSLKVKFGALGVKQDPRADGWILRYFFADPSVVRLSQSLDIHVGGPSVPPPVHFAAYLVVQSTWALVQMVFFFTIFQFLAGRAWGRDLLLRHPKLFTGGLASKQGPTAEQLAGASFTETFYAKGYSTPPSSTTSKSVPSPDVTLIGRITGPEPGYVATPKLFIKCALAMLRTRVDAQKGVLTPAVLFRSVRLLDEMKEEGWLGWTITESSS